MDRRRFFLACIAAGIGSVVPSRKKVYTLRFTYTYAPITAIGFRVYREMMFEAGSMTLDEVRMLRVEGIG